MTRLALALLVAPGCATDHTRVAADAGVARDSASAPDAGLTVPPESLWAQVTCEDGGTARLFVEVYPDGVVSECVPEASITDLIVLGIDGWDGLAGSFVLGEPSPRGRAGLGVGISSDPPTGTLTVEPFDERPHFVSWDSSAGEGRVDLGLCGRIERLPCP
jgi:hypothetical protein